MELLIAVGLLVAFWLLRSQGKRISQLESQIIALRTANPDGAIVAAPQVTETLEAEPAIDTASLPQADNAAADEPAPDLSNPEEPAADAVAGPWQQAARASAAEAAVAAEKTRPDIETALGTRWAVWVGGVALALGGVFLVRYTIEAGLLGPAVRLALGAVFGIVLLGVGEAARRFGFRAPVGGLDAAYVPAILTAAGAVTLFAVAFTAHGLYGFIGAGTAFLALGAIAFGTIALALVHGQSLAGLGLLGSYLTPMLVSSTSPSIWALFGYLSVVLAATVAVAAIRRWRFLAAAAYAGAGLWSVAYLVDATPAMPLPVALTQLVGLAALAGIWLARPSDGEGASLEPASICAGLFAALCAVLVLPVWQPSEPWAAAVAAVLMTSMLAVAAVRVPAIALLHGAGIALTVAAGRHLLAGRYEIDLYAGHVFIDGNWVSQVADPFLPFSYLLAGLLLAGGIAMAWLTVAGARYRAAQWAFWAAVAPLAVVGAAWLTMGDLNVDWRFAAPALGIAAILVVAGEAVARAERHPMSGGWAVSILLAGSAAALCLGLLAGFAPLWTTILTGIAAALPAAATRLRRYRALGWIAAGFGAVTLARVAVDPTIVGAGLLGTTPFLNALLPAYLLPAIVFGYAAWQLLQTTKGRPRLVMEALAAIFALVGAAMLVRHAMNGGVIVSGPPTLAEQSIYTLILIGAGAIMLALDSRSPSPVFRWGSIAAGVVGVATVLVLHLFALNPYLLNETTGRIPVLNLLLIGYLMPGAALLALAWLARGRRPGWYTTMLAAVGALMIFAYVTLSVRRVFHGECIGSWKGFGALETYTYSAVWLALGVAVLAAGIRAGSRTLRLASSLLVVAAVAKVFLWDMRELEGVLRALSFIGLGGVLIGIGMFYQRMLASAPR